MLSEPVQDHIKAIYKLQTEERSVSTSALAIRMGTSAAAVTKMVKHLAGLDLALHTPYHGVRLTGTGEKAALEVIRHHRLVELFLTRIMGYTWDEVDAEAERLEHVISEEFETRIDMLLGHPSICPHGDPIPTLDGQLTEKRLATLAECVAGETVVIARVRDRDSSVLRALTARQMSLHTAVEVLEREAPDDLLTVRVGADRHIVGPALAGSVFVVRTGEQEMDKRD